MYEMLIRLCWNEFGWERPSDSCRHEEGFPKNCGFGHEEWNLRTDQSVDGYIYGHMGPIPRKLLDSGEPFRIGFWAIDRETKKKLLAGLYLEAEPSKLDDKKKGNYVDQVFLENGYYDVRADELYGLGTYYTNQDCIGGRDRKITQKQYTYENSYKIVRELVTKSSLGIKCHKDKVIKLDEYLELPDKIWSTSRGSMKSLHSYFYNPYYIEDSKFFPSLLTTVGINLDVTGHISTSPIDRKSKRKKPVRKDRSRAKPSGKSILSIQEKYIRTTTRSAKIIEPKHSKLVFDFSEWLKKQYKIESIAEGRFIDLQFIHKDMSYLVEAKVIHGSSPKYSIREALGQVLEYNFYDEKSEMDRWIILLNNSPDNKDKEFITRLVEKFHIPLYLAWRDKKDFKLLGNPFN